MKLPKLLPIALLAATLSGTALADCTAPDLSLKIPDGSKATKEELLAAKRAVADLNNTVVDYQTCIKGELDAKIAAAGDKLSEEGRNKMQADSAKLENAAVDKLTKLADKLNLEIRAFKSRQPAQ